MPCMFATCSRQRCTKWVLDKHRCWGCKSGMISGISSLRPSNCIPMRKHQHLHPHRHESGRFIMYAAPQNLFFRSFWEYQQIIRIGASGLVLFFWFPTMNHMNCSAFNSLRLGSGKQRFQSTRSLSKDSVSPQQRDSSKGSKGVHHKDIISVFCIVNYYLKLNISKYIG